MKSILVLIVVISMAVTGRARHIQPHVVSSWDDGDLNVAVPQDIVDALNTSADEVKNIKPTRFVPINNVIFFKKFSPCEEGFERDLFGICREVWN